jgi:hypothetical protein
MVNKSLIASRAMETLGRQETIPGSMFSNERGQPSMCVGAALLFSAAQEAGHDVSSVSFFEPLRERDADESRFVESKSAEVGLDAASIWRVIIIMKSRSERERKLTVSDLLKHWAAPTGRVG